MQLSVNIYNNWAYTFNANKCFGSINQKVKCGNCHSPCVLSSHLKCGDWIVLISCVQLAITASDISLRIQMLPLKWFSLPCTYCAGVYCSHFAVFSAFCCARPYCAFVCIWWIVQSSTTEASLISYWASIHNETRPATSPLLHSFPPTAISRSALPQPWVSHLHNFFYLLF